MESFTKSLPDDFKLYEFKIERVLGQGGFGITYLALDMNLMQHVAIKEYFPREFAARDSTFTIHAMGNSEDKDTFAWGLRRFLDEARVLAQMSHPNIISVKRFFEAYGTAYLVMEYCDGKPLDEVIRDHGPLNKDELGEILYPLLDGLEHVHAKAFLHRDIKPANIFIRKNGSPVLLDFGASKHEMTSHSRSVTSLATAGYAPFEQYSTKGKQGTWSDIYGLAATIYRAISGLKPQGAPDRMLDDSLQPASTLLKGKFDQNVLAAIDKALSIRPEDRPQTVSAFRELIEKGSPKGDSYVVGKTATNAGGGVAVSSNNLNPKNTAISNLENSAADPIKTGRDISVRRSSKKYLYMLCLVVAVAGLSSWAILKGLSEETGTSGETGATPESAVASAKVTPLSVEPVIPTETLANSSPPHSIQKTQETSSAASKPSISFIDVDRAIREGKLQNAESLISVILKNDPDSAGAYFRLAQIYAQQGKYTNARGLLNKAKNLDPSLRFVAKGKYQEFYNEVLALERMSKLPGRDNQ